MAEKKSCIDYCPFTHRACTECGIYRGRHRHLLPANGPGVDRVAEYFKAIESEVSPKQETGKEKAPVITLKVIDMENRKIKVCEYAEARAWDWGDPTIMRLIDGWQVKSYDNLIDILRHKEEQGHKEAEMQECPRFMLLSGG
jgi:hypothetical protein